MNKDVAEALLIWKHPVERSRFVIGRLKRHAAGYTFQNEFDEPYSLTEALASGFTPLDPFGAEKKVFRSDSLFPIFARRLPPEWRREEYTRLGLQEDDDIEYLVKTGGRMAGDTFEFLDSVQAGESSTELRLDFPVAGWRYYDGEKVLDELKPGTSLRLELDKNNEHDSSAIRILSPSGALLGYVPRVYSWYFDDCIEEQRYQSEVKAVGPQSDPQLRMMVCFQLSERDARLRRVPEGLKTLAPA